MKTATCIGLMKTQIVAMSEPIRTFIEQRSEMGNTLLKEVRQMTDTAVDVFGQVSVIASERTSSEEDMQPELDALFQLTNKCLAAQVALADLMSAIHMEDLRRTGLAPA